MTGEGGNSWCAPDAAASLVDSAMRPALERIDSGHGTALLLVLGLPCTGKTALRVALERIWVRLEPAVLRQSYWIMPRDRRLARHLGENDPGAFDFDAMLDAARRMCEGKSLEVREYLHQRGADRGGPVRTLGPTRLLYLQGTAWYYLRQQLSFDSVVLTTPVSREEWRRAYVDRAIRTRGYSLEQAEEACSLLETCWYEPGAFSQLVPNLVLMSSFVGSELATRFLVNMSSEAVLPN